MSDLFNEKAQEWDTNTMIQQLSAAVGKSILEQVQLQPTMQVMDFGAGTGLVSSHVAPLVEKITAVDISPAMLEKLRGKSELQGKIEIVCQDILNKALDKKFDLIISAMAMHHVKDINQLFRTFAEHLNPGARVALADLDKEDGTFHPADIEGVYHQGFDRQSIESMLQQNGFSDVQFTTAHTVNKEGKTYPIFLVTANRSYS